MKATYIDYSDTGSFSKTLIAYLAQQPDLASFYGNFPNMAGFRKQIEAKKKFSHREVLVEQLRAQYGDLLTESPEVAQNLERLLGANCYTVTTGHQLNIFTGPLYFIFKIVTAIKLARDLKEAFPEEEFVPVYWMATEDHDFAEINHTRVFGKKISWDTDGISGTGRMDTSSMEAVVKQYCNTFGLSDNASKLTELVHEAYSKNRNLADATRVFVNSLFRAYGLVIVDADSPVLKKLFAPIMEQDILTENSFKAIEATSKSLEELGYAPQVHAREINFFYLTDSLRERIVRTEDGRFEVLHQDLFFTRRSCAKK